MDINSMASQGRMQSETNSEENAHCNKNISLASQPPANVKSKAQKGSSQLHL